MAALQTKIKKEWYPPTNLPRTNLVVRFKVAAAGEVSDLAVHKSSGVAKYDNAGLEAVRRAAPFASLPKGSPDKVDIEFTFDLWNYNDPEFRKQFIKEHPEIKNPFGTDPVKTKGK